MSKKALKLANRHPMLLALIMATLTLGLLFSGWLTPSHLRAAGATYSNPTPPPNGENTNCDNPTKYLWCAGNAQVVFKDVTISPAAPTNAPYDSIVCVGATVSANLQWFAVPSTYASQTCHTCNGSTPTNYCDPIVYTTGAWPYNIINEWWNDYCWDWPNEIGNSVSFSYTNAMAGCMGFDNISAMMPTNPAGCDVLWYWANNAHSERYYAFVAVDDLSAQYCWPVSDDGINKTYMVCVVPTNAPDTNITVVASPAPWMYDKFLPAGWNMAGGLATTNSDTNDCFISRTKRLVDITKPGTNVVTCVSGCSQKKVTIIAQLVTLGLAKTNLMVNNDDDNNDGTNDVDDPISGPGSQVNGESDLIPLTLNVQCIAPTQMVTLSVSMDWWGGGVRVWTNSTRGPGEPLLDNSDWSKLSTNWPASQMPATLWVEGVSPSWYLNDVTLSLTTADGCPATTNLTVYYMGLGADVYHKHSITSDDLSPLYFWVNDVSVSGDIIADGTDVPGSGNNGTSGQVNGRCDVENFTPVGLNFGNTLELLSPTNGYEYRLIGSGVSIVYTALNTGQAFSYLTDATGTSGYGSGFNVGAYAADTVPVNGYAVLSTGFLTNALNNGGTGLVLMEGGGATTQPLKLEVWKNGHKIGGGGQLNLSIASVETMYRQINLRGGYSGAPAAPSNYPTNICNGNMLAFVHGYNVNATAARGWNAEMFKRLYQSGSRAMFTGVDWQGDDGQLPIAGGVTPGYYKNVVHAFDTALYFASAMRDLSGDKYIAAHSLGNMVVSSAIEDWSQVSSVAFHAKAYFMIDAAVAIEAYNSAAFGSGNLVNPHYWPNYDSRLYASRWNELFASNSSDGRNGLTWRGRFGDVSGINYYSSTEDVLTNADGQLHWPASRHFSWVTQEMRKGTVWPGQLFGGEAGWGFNIYYSTYSISDADGISDTQLKANSFFGSFNDSTLYDSGGGSAEAAKAAVREQVLADGIPAWSNAAGGPAGNGHNMNDDKAGTYNQGTWPRSGNDWRHSDIKNIAYPFNHSVFDSISGYLQ